MQKSKLSITVNSPVIASKPTCTVCSKLVGYEMLGLSDRSLFFLWGTLTFKVFFFSDSGSLGKGRRSTGTTGTASFLSRDKIFSHSVRSSNKKKTFKYRLLVSLTGGAGGLSSSSAIFTNFHLPKLNKMTESLQFVENRRKYTNTVVNDPTPDQQQKITAGSIFFLKFDSAEFKSEIFTFVLLPSKTISFEMKKIRKTI